MAALAGTTRMQESEARGGGSSHRKGPIGHPTELLLEFLVTPSHMTMQEAKSVSVPTTGPWKE